MNELELNSIGLHKCKGCGGPIFLEDKYCLSCEIVSFRGIIK